MDENANSDDGISNCFIVEWGNGECVPYDIDTEEEAIDFWKEHLNDRMPILDMWNYYTDKHLTKPEQIL